MSTTNELDESTALEKKISKIEQSSGHDVELGDSPPSSSHNNHQKSVAEKPSTAIWILVCLGLYLGALLYGLDTTIAADVQASAYLDLGEIEKLPWIGVGFPMGSVAVILLIGRLYGTFEIKWLILTSLVLFEAGSALCGAAPSMNALIVGRVLAGIGGAGLYLGALTYISVFTSLKERPLYNALVGLAWGVGAVLGPVVGGAFSQSSATWRWSFYINLPLAAILSPVYIYYFPRFQPKPEESAWAKLASLDWLGAFLNAGVFIIFMVTLTFSGSLFSWDSPRSIALWTVFGVFLVAYIIQQQFAILTTRDRRIFPVHFLRSRTMVLLYVATSCAAASNAVALYYIPLYFQFTRGDDALDAAVRLLPFIVLFIASVMFSGGLLPVFGRYAPWYFPAGALMLAGGACMHSVTPNTSVAAVYGYEILIAVGSGIIFQVAYAVVASKVEPHDVPNSIGFINVAQIGTIAISLSMAGSIFQNVGFNKLKEALVSYNLPDAVVRSALAGVDSPLLQSGNKDIIALVVGAVSDTMAKTYAMNIAAGALALVAAMGMRWEKLELVPTAGG